LIYQRASQQPEKGGADENKRDARKHETAEHRGRDSPTVLKQKRQTTNTNQGEKNMTSHQRIAVALLATLLSALAWPALAAGAEGSVNINTADAEQLSLLPRVGAVVAQRIIDFREQNGKFKEAQDLMLIKGIGEKTFELIEPYVNLAGETTLTEKVSVPRPAATEKK